MINSGKKLYIVIPAFNEQKAIGSTIQSLHNEGYSNILVINDGSVDETAWAAQEAGAEVISHIINRGQGAALQTGIEYARETYEPDVIVTFDADGQHRPEDIPSLIRPVTEEGFDIALGSRFLTQDSNVPFLRKIILKAGIIFTRFVSNIKLTDTHNGLRALGKKAMDSIDIAHRGMEHASDIIDEISRKKLKYMEVPVKVIYSEYSRQKGQKTSGFIKMGIKILIKKIT